MFQKLDYRGKYFMDHYIDILIKPATELTQSQLMSLLYNKFHNALVQINMKKIGVSFPQCQIKPGCVFRIHGDMISLNKLQDSNWLDGIAQYFQINDLKLVPAAVEYRTISRFRTNMSKSKLARLKRRGTINADEEKVYKAKMFAQGLTNPYFDLESGSTGQRFRLFIQMSQLREEHSVGDFDTYGLSKVATIPWF